MLSTSRQSIKGKASFLPFFIFMMGAILFEVTTWDLQVNDLFYNFEAGYWQYGQSWWADQLIHKIGNQFVKIVAASAVLVFVASFCFSRAHHLRRAALYVMLVIGLSTGLVALGKQTTNIDCPSQIERYNGSKPYIRLFEKKPHDIKHGKCFPGGHSSGAFSFVFLYFLMRDSTRFKKYAKAGLAFSIGLGSIYAFGQWARGSHYPSHDWYSFFICWFIAWSLYHFAFKGRVLAK
jgi:membrane-associated PAP2 superfamily phosphatase